MAAEAMFGKEIRANHTREFREIFMLVSTGQAIAGVVPLENALAGTVQESYDLLAEFEEMVITAEYYCPVQLHLMGIHKPDGSLPEINELEGVASHYKALEQCAAFFNQFPSLKQEIHADTAGAAAQIKTRGDYRVAAVASDFAAQLYGLSIIKKSIQDHKVNLTRFVAIAKGRPYVDNPTKASLIFTLDHVPGALSTVLQKIAITGINLSKIESRPISGLPFEYKFYVDVESDGKSTVGLEELVTQLSKCTRSLRVLGLYQTSPAEISVPSANTPLS